MSRAPNIGRRRKYNIEELQAKHHSIMQLHIFGFKQEDIASALQIDRRTVSETLNSDIGKRQLDLIKASIDKKTIDVSQRLSDLVPSAVKIYEEILNEGKLNGMVVDAKTIRTVAKEILAAHVDKMDPKKGAVAPINVFTVNDLNDIKRIALEKSNRNKEVEDATFAVVE